LFSPIPRRKNFGARRGTTILAGKKLAEVSTDNAEWRFWREKNLAEVSINTVELNAKPKAVRFFHILFSQHVSTTDWTLSKYFLK
jgi:hypothetical protein